MYVYILIRTSSWNELRRSLIRFSPYLCQKCSSLTSYWLQRFYITFLYSRYSFLSILFSLFSKSTLSSISFFPRTISSRITKEWRRLQREADNLTAIFFLIWGTRPSQDRLETRAGPDRILFDEKGRNDDTSSSSLSTVSFGFLHDEDEPSNGFFVVKSRHCLSSHACARIHCRGKYELHFVLKRESRQTRDSLSYFLLVSHCIACTTNISYRSTLV